MSYLGKTPKSSADELRLLLDSKAAAVHGHAIADIANLQNTLSGKANSSHSHDIANVSGLQAALNTYATLASPTFTGTPTAPTVATTDNSTSIATTAHVKESIAKVLTDGNKIFYEDLTIYVRLTGNDALGTGLTAASAFASVQRAVVWCQDKVTIRGKSKIIIDVGAGSFNYTGIIGHYALGCQIVIKGAAMLGNALYGISADGSADTYKVTGNSAASRSSDGIFNLAKLESRFATKLYHTGPTEAAIRVESHISLERVLLVCDGTPPTTNAPNMGIACSHTGKLGLQDVAVHNAGQHGIVLYAGCLAGPDYTTDPTRVGVSNCGASGVVVTSSSHFYTRGSDLTVVSNEDHGIYNNNGNLNTRAACSGGNGEHGIVTDDCGSIHCPESYSVNNGHFGIYSSSNSHIWCGNSRSVLNLIGIVADHGGNIEANGSTVSSNVADGLNSNTGGVLEMQNGVMSTNGNRQAIATDKGYINLTGSTTTSSSPVHVEATSGAFIRVGNNITATSPAIGYIGNQNAYIST